MGALVTGTGGLASYIARYFISQGVPCSLYGTTRQIDAVRQIVDTSKLKIFKGDILDADSLNIALRDSGLIVVKNSDSSVHTFTIQELNVNVENPASRTSLVAFTADKPGTYTFFCAIPGHREGGMEGKLTLQG